MAKKATKKSVRVSSGGWAARAVRSADSRSSRSVIRSAESGRLVGLSSSISDAQRQSALEQMARRAR